MRGEKGTFRKITRLVRLPNVLYIEPERLALFKIDRKVRALQTKRECFIGGFVDRSHLIWVISV